MKRNLLSVLILALSIVNIVLSAIIMVNISSSDKQITKLLENAGTAMSLELTSPGQAVASLTPTVDMGDTDLHTINDLTIPLATGSDGKQSYMVGSITLSINKKNPDYKKKSGQILDGTLDPLIKDKLNTVVGSYTKEEINANREALKAEILAAIQQLVGSDMVYQISFGDINFG